MTKQNDNVIETKTTTTNQNMINGSCISSSSRSETEFNKNNTTSTNGSSSSKQEKTMEGEYYVGKKPKWWKRVAGRRGSKQQRWALTNLISTNYWTSLSTIQNHSMTEKYKERCLEIGCGQGHVLLENAKNYPHRLYIGADIHKTALGALLLRMYQPTDTDHSVDHHQDNNDYDDDTTKNNHNDYNGNYKNQYENVILYGGDGMQWLRPKRRQQQQQQDGDTNVPPDDWFHSIYITFPDPFPKHSQYRIIQKESLQWMHRVLEKNVGCVFVATDDEQFANWSQSIFESSSSSWSPVIPCPPRSSWLPIISTYEQKGINEGRQTHLQCWKCI